MIVLRRHDLLVQPCCVSRGKRNASTGCRCLGSLVSGCVEILPRAAGSLIGLTISGSSSLCGARGTVTKHPVTAPPLSSPQLSTAHCVQRNSWRDCSQMSRDGDHQATLNAINEREILSHSSKGKCTIRVLEALRCARRYLCMRAMDDIHGSLAILTTGAITIRRGV